ncbi:MAG: 4-alpha-glucanotransferase [Chloroflexi bacterium]|nr:4-alpha-glucanotransferase [Chloroflexota bacterium]
MAASRRCGILCHPTSLPSDYGIGDLGSGAEQFIAYLESAGQTIWQVLPLGPTGYGDSPYQPFSAFAGNHLLISPELLAADGLLTQSELEGARVAPGGRIDYGTLIVSRTALLQRSYERFLASSSNWELLDDFREANRAWLDDYALFMALKARFELTSWHTWPREIALRKPAAMAGWCSEVIEQISFHRYLQLQFHRQWQRVRELARNAGISLIGDMPIFVGHDSADVWAHRELFQLDEAGMPRAVAGVPPDAFSPTGQLWGNPLYDWAQLARTDYAWWVARLQHALALVDEVRLDHFRGFAGYWQVPAGDPTAEGGRWVKGPGAAFFASVREQLGALPIIAEDLGLISADVIALRQELGLPGMRVLQFAFDSDAANEHLPHNWERDLVTYTGTHDNNTTLGWYAAASPAMRSRVRAYVGDVAQMNWAFIRLALNSVADTVVIPLQDVLGLGAEARLNTPGNPGGNWQWRCEAAQLTPDSVARLASMSQAANRSHAPGQAPAVNEPAVLDYAVE